VQRLVVRDPARAPRLPGAEVVYAPGYGDREAMRDPLTGVDTLYLVSAREDRDRVALHTSAVDAAVAAGIERIVYVSYVNAAPDATFTFARDHFHTEEHIRASGVAFTFLRSNQYLDFVPIFASADGVIRGSADDGRVGSVARDDAADVAVAVLTAAGEHDGRTYEVTGPETLTVAEMAERLSRIVGRRITYVEETLEEARASRAPSGAPDWEIEGWVTSYAAIATGEMDVVTDTVPRLAGHDGQTLEDFLQRHPESYAHLVEA
jgi:NAD(P)H dehydrogenase (quinone)